MGALGQLLELLHDAHASVRTFEIEYQDWGRPPPSNDVIVSYADPGKPQVRWRGAGPWPKAALSTRRIWLQSPDLARVEIFTDQALVRLAVRNGSQWWRWDAEQGVIGGSALPDPRGLPTLPAMLAMPMLDVRRLITAMWLEPAGVGERAGRRVLCARGRPRVQPPTSGPLHYELEFDAEHGSLLRRAEFDDGRCVWERLAAEVLYGADIDRECFVFVAPDEDLAR